MTGTRLRTHCSQPKYDGCGDADCREVGMGATVVSGVDAPPVFEAPEHVFDSVALFVEDGVYAGSRFCGWLWKECRGRCGAWRGRRGTSRRCNPCRPEVAWPSVWRTASTRHPCSHFCPSLKSMTSGCPLPSHTACSLEFKPPLSPCRGTGPFLRLAAVRWLEMCGVYHDPLGIAALCANAAKILFYTPRRLQRTTHVDRLVRTIARWGVAPTKPILHHKHNRAHDPTVVHPRDAMRQRKIPHNPTHLSQRQQEQITHRQSLPASPMNQPIRPSARTLIGPEPSDGG